MANLKGQESNYRTDITGESGWLDHLYDINIVTSQIRRKISEVTKSNTFAKMISPLYKHSSYYSSNMGACWNY